MFNTVVPLVTEKFLLTPEESSNATISSLVVLLYVTANPVAVPPTTVWLINLPETNDAVEPTPARVSFWYELCESIISFTKKSWVDFVIVWIPVLSEVKSTMVFNDSSSANLKLSASI